MSEEGAAQSLVSPNVTQLDSPAPESVIEALHFDLRSDTESVRSGDPQDAVDSTDEDDEWSVAGTEEVASRRLRLESQDTGRCRQLSLLSII